MVVAILQPPSRTIAREDDTVMNGERCRDQLSRRRGAAKCLSSNKQRAVARRPTSAGATWKRSATSTLRRRYSTSLTSGPPPRCKAARSISVAETGTTTAAGIETTTSAVPTIQGGFRRAYRLRRAGRVTDLGNTSWNGTSGLSALHERSRLAPASLLVGGAGFEPATNGLKVRCSTN